MAMVMKGGMCRVFRERNKPCTHQGFVSSWACPLVTLYPMGEAYDRFGYRGEVYSDQIDLLEDAFGDPPFNMQLKVISRPVSAWWAEVRLTSGRTGWVVVNGASFDGIGGCE
jgi:hypothetical protein